jgi:hypothetical protein
VLLNEWSQKNLQQIIVFGATGLTHCDGAEARQRLIATFGCTTNDRSLDCATTGVDNQNLITISVCPNPTKDKLCIQGLSTSSKVSICTVFGKLVFSKTTSSEVDLN